MQHNIIGHRAVCSTTMQRR